MRSICPAGAGRRRTIDRSGDEGLSFDAGNQMIGDLDMQQFWYLLIMLGGLGVAIGTWGSSREKDKSSARDKAALQLRLDGVTAQLAKFDAQQGKNTETLLNAIGAKPNEQWQSVQLTNIPDVVADFALMLFRADHGRINGKVRIRGSKAEAFFSTSANDRMPIAVPNVWDPKTGLYHAPAFLEYTITEVTEPNAHLSILTAGWIDFRGAQPHL